MAVLKITKQRFDELAQAVLQPHAWPPDREHDWFTDHSGRLLGVVLHDADQQRWGFFVLLLGDDGRYRTAGGGAGYDSAESAASELVAKMRGFDGHSWLDETADAV